MIILKTIFWMLIAVICPKAALKEIGDKIDGSRD